MSTQCIPFIVWLPPNLMFREGQFISKTCFIRCISVASNAIHTIDNDVSYLIIYCLNCIRRDWKCDVWHRPKGRGRPDAVWQRKANFRFSTSFNFYNPSLFFTSLQKNLSNLLVNYVKKTRKQCINTCKSSQNKARGSQKKAPARTLVNLWNLATVRFVMDAPFHWANCYLDI